MKHFFLTLFLFILTSLNAQSYRTQPISPEIHTIEVNKNGKWEAKPIINLNSDDFIHIGFDRLSDQSTNRLRYTIYHCDANWNKSKGISEIEYLDGFNDNVIEEYIISSKTTVSYTHFNLSIPNKDVNVKLSGNYLVEIYEDDLPDSILLTACFCVVDTKLNIGCSISSVTDIDSNKAHQQLSVTLNHSFSLRDATTELKTIVIQNNRLDTKRRLLKPSFIGGNKIVFDHIKDLIFEAGNEYRRFEIASYRQNGMNVAHIEYDGSHYSMYLAKDKIREGRAYSYDQDQNGRFIISNRESENVENESDYFVTQFRLIVNDQFPYDVYLNGSFTNNTYTDKYKMMFDPINKEYFHSLLLKQGLYNYFYATKMFNQISAKFTEGNFHETENEYTIYVYYNPQGQRYDSLVGVTTIQSKNR